MADRVVKKVYAEVGTIDNASTKLVKIEKSTDRVTKKFQKGERQARSFGKTLKRAITLRAVAGFKKLDAGINRALKSMAKFGLKAAKVGAIGLFAGTIGLGILSGKLAAQREQTDIIFKNLTGSAQKGQEVVQSLIKFSDITPFEPDEVIQAGKLLTSFGITGDKLIPTLTNIGDVAAGLGIPFTELSEIFGKIKVQGTVMSEDLNQLAGRGIPIFDQLAKQMGINASEVKKFASQGKISFKDINRAFVELTAAGAPLGGTMEALSKSALGMWSTLKGKVMGIMVRLGKVILAKVKPALEQAVKAVSIFDTWLKGTDRSLADLRKNLVQLSPVFGKLFDIIVGIIDAVRGGVSFFAKWGKTILFIVGIVLTLITVFKVLNVILAIQAAIVSASPVTWIILGIVAAVAALIALIVLVVKNWDKITAAVVWFGKVAFKVLRKIGGAIFDYYTLPLRGVLTVLSKIGVGFAKTGLQKMNQFSDKIKGNETTKTGTVESDSINDGIVTKTGKVIKTHPDDNIFAMKADPTDMMGKAGGREIKISFGDIVITGSVSPRETAGRVKDGILEALNAVVPRLHAEG